MSLNSRGRQRKKHQNSFLPTSCPIPHLIVLFIIIIFTYLTYLSKSLSEELIIIFTINS